MEKQLVAVTLISTILGALAGFAMTYVVLQPQIQSLQSSVETTNSNVATLESEVDTLNQDIESELGSLNQNVTTLDLELGEIKNRTWHKAFSLEGGTVGAVGDKFQIRGKWIRIRWYMYGPVYIGPHEPMDLTPVETSWIRITIKFSNGTSYTHRGSSGAFGSYSCDLDIQPGEYFLEIENNGDPYLVVVWDYY